MMRACVPRAECGRCHEVAGSHHLAHGGGEPPQR
jgi:hypothetical protein